MTTEPSNKHDRDWDNLRRRILFYAGLIGVFLYVALVDVLRADFHIEFLLAFLAMMGVSIAQGVDKK